MLVSDFDDALEEAARMANEVYISLAANDFPCKCGNGRIPVSAYREAVDAFATAIRKRKSNYKEQTRKQL